MLELLHKTLDWPDFFQWQGVSILVYLKGIEYFGGHSSMILLDISSYPIEEDEEYYLGFTSSWLN